MADAALVPGEKIAGRYQVVKLLGQGGMGAVYQARQLSMDRMVALKLIHPKAGHSDETVKRFQREMQAGSRIEHPNVIEVFDYGEDQGRLFLAMEFLDGKPLSKVLEAGPLPVPRILHIAGQIVRALGAAHQRGIAHRDLKPDNVMLLERYGESDFVKVLDFGIARFLEDGGDVSHMTAEGALIGTPMYMSPEQALGQAIDHRSDFYSLGVMLYQMALGRPPFVGPTLASLIVAHAHEAPTPPSTLKPGLVPPPLEALILRLLAKSPAERPADAAALLQDLQGASSLGFADTVLPAERVQSTPKKSNWLFLGAIGFLVVGGAAAGWRLSRPPAAATAEARARLEALVLADGDPLAPPDCRATDPEVVDKLARGTAWLHDSIIGSPRPQDRDALMLLENLKEGGAEFWALLSRARLVVEPNPDGARKAAQLAVQRCPQLALGYNLLGNAEQRSKRPADATAAYKKALELQPDYLAPRFNLGLLSLRAGDAAAAVSAFDSVLAKNPQHPRAHLARGQAHLLLNQLPAALDDLEQAALRHPDQAEAWLLLGHARTRAGTIKGAEEAFCKAKLLGSDEAAKLCP
jgi:tetratricopeptide (TPR) repeat protein/predicted Ser/Thr protein kinase